VRASAGGSRRFALSPPNPCSQLTLLLLGGYPRDCPGAIGPQTFNKSSIKDSTI
jgi:hypothetical protein